MRNPFLQVVGVMIDNEGAGRSQTMFSREDEQKFISLSKTPDLYEVIAQSIAPAIFGHSGMRAMKLTFD